MLSPEQLAELSRYRALWREHSLSTQPADREGAESAMRALYQQAGFAQPEQILWCGSPMALLKKASSLGGRGMWHGIAGAASEPAWQAIWSDLETSTASRIWKTFENTLWHTQDVHSSLTDPIGFPGEPDVGATFTQAKGELVGIWQCAETAVSYQHPTQGWYEVWSRWFGDLLPVAAFVHEVLDLPGSASISPLAQLASSAGPWIARDRVALISERPTVLTLDDQDRLHNEDGPALAWPDGTALHYWHGVRVSRQIIEAPETLDAYEILKEPNAERRRIMLERFGYERFLRVSAMTELDRERDGSALWRTMLPDDEPLVLVELVNSTFGESFFRIDASERIEGRRLSMGIWRWTDDTAMAVSTVETLDRHGRIDQDDLARRFATRYVNDPARGYGGAMHHALSEIHYGAHWRSVARSLFDGSGSFGNGAAMRAPVIGAWFADDLERVTDEARRSAEVTHAHREGIAGAIAVATAAALACRGAACPTGDALLEEVLDQIPASELRERTTQALELRDQTPVREAAQVLGNGSEVSAQDTVPLVLWCTSQRVNDYEEALWLTVAALGDRDTTCAMVGGIVASRVGAEGLPAVWLARREPLPSARSPLPPR